MTSENFETLVEEVISIPHLDLGFQFDVEKMISEVDKVTRFDYYQSSDKISNEHYEKHWSGVSLVGSNGDPYIDLTEAKPGQKSTYQKTEIADLCPYLYSIVEQLGGQENQGQRARIMRIGPDGSLYWHSHCLQHYQPKSQLTIHVPIVVPDGFEWSVIHADDFIQYVSSLRDKRLPDRSGKLEEIDNQVYRKSYKTGTANVFNSYHFHNVHNPDLEKFRISLMVYVDLKSPVVQNLVAKAIEKYNGPKLKPATTALKIFSTRSTK